MNVSSRNVIGAAMAGKRWYRRDWRCCVCVYAVSHKKRFENRPRGDRPGDRRENSVHDASTSHSIGGEEIGNGKNHKRRCRAKSDKTDQAKKEEEIGEVCPGGKFLYKKAGKKRLGDWQRRPSTMEQGGHMCEWHVLISQSPTRVQRSSSMSVGSGGWRWADAKWSGI